MCLPFCLLIFCFVFNYLIIIKKNPREAKAPLDSPAGALVYFDDCTVVIKKYAKKKRREKCKLIKQFQY